MIRETDPKQFEIRWKDSGREPKCDSNPLYPFGIDVGLVPEGMVGCRVKLPYPAKRIGMFSVFCKLCGCTLAISTAGRADDPRTVSVVCNQISTEKENEA